MKFSEFIENLAKQYAVGAVAFYGNQPDDKKKKALDYYELNTKMTDEDTSILYGKLIHLNSVYKQLGIQPNRVDFSDAFYLRNRDTREKMQSTIEKACAKCGDKKSKLTMKRDIRYNSFLICDECDQNAHTTS